ncbi:MAG: hypothetical protein ACRDJE_09755 [Dehalococcoidia bacterium]
MERAIVVKGRVVGPTTVELDQPVAGVAGEVDVVLRILDTGNGTPEETIFDFLRRLPPGTRSKDEIDQQVRAERESWDDR